jgi:hypothetical protein
MLPVADLEEHPRAPWTFGGAEFRGCDSLQGGFGVIGGGYGYLGPGRDSSGEGVRVGIPRYRGRWRQVAFIAKSMFFGRSIVIGKVVSVGAPRGIGR